MLCSKLGDDEERVVLEAQYQRYQFLVIRVQNRLQEK